MEIHPSDQYSGDAYKFHRILWKGVSAYRKFYAFSGFSIFVMQSSRIFFQLKKRTLGHISVGLLCPYTLLLKKLMCFVLVLSAQNCCSWRRLSMSCLSLDHWNIFFVHSFLKWTVHYKNILPPTSNHSYL